MTININYQGVDWVTATSTSDKIGSKWYTLFASAAKEGQYRLPINDRWNNGWYAGLSIDGLKFGYNEKRGYILIASSDRANMLWPEIQAGPKRITRLDLCVDIVLPACRPLARESFALNSDNAEKGNRKYTLWGGNDGGSTLYVGSRQSSQYGRLYDKGVESGLAEPGLYWRFEVEFKKPLSMAMADNLTGLRGRSLDTEITNQVATWFVDRNVLCAENIARGQARPVMAMQRQTTVDRKLAWLRTQVSPTVRMLMEAGLGRQVVLALFQDTGDIKQMLDEADQLVIQ